MSLRTATRSLCLVAAAFLVATPPLAFTDVDFSTAHDLSVSLDSDTVEVGKAQFRRKKNGLVLRGTCHLTYFGFQIADAALYMRQGDPKERVLESTYPKELEFYYLRSISARDFAKSTRELIQKNETSPPTDYSVQGLEKEVADFNALYRDVSFGDVYNLCYNNQTATSTLSLNGRVIGSTTGADFSVALFSVWFGKVCFMERLKRDLLAKEQQ